MTQTKLIEELVSFCLKCTKKMKLPEPVEKGDKNKTIRSPTIYKMRLSDSHSFFKYAPYIIVQLSNSYQVQPEGKDPESNAVVRFIFCVWSEDESEGAMMLLNVMDKIRTELLTKVMVGKFFELNVNEPLESIPYPDNSAPFFGGEIVGTFKIPSIKRSVNYGF